MKIFLVLMLVPSIAFGAITWIQDNSCADADSDVACAYGTNVTADSLLIIQCGNGGGGSANMTVADTQSNTWNKVSADDIQQSEGSGSAFSNIFYVTAANAGATTVTCTDTDTSGIQINIHEYSVGTTPAIYDAMSSSAPTASLANPVSGDITTTADNEFVFNAAMFTGGSATGQSGTLRENYVDWYYSMTQDEIVASAGSHESTFTAAAGNWISIQASFLETGQGGDAAGAGELIFEPGSGLISTIPGTGRIDFE